MVKKVPSPCSLQPTKADPLLLYRHPLIHSKASLKPSQYYLPLKIKQVWGVLPQILSRNSKPIRHQRAKPMLMLCKQLTQVRWAAKLPLKGVLLPRQRLKVQLEANLRQVSGNQDQASHQGRLIAYLKLGCPISKDLRFQWILLRKSPLLLEGSNLLLPDQPCQRLKSKTLNN